jgi:hypothetical protein
MQINNSYAKLIPDSIICAFFSTSSLIPPYRILPDFLTPGFRSSIWCLTPDDSRKSEESGVLIIRDSFPKFYGELAQLEYRMVTINRGLRDAIVEQFSDALRNFCRQSPEERLLEVIKSSFPNGGSESQLIVDRIKGLKL